MIGAPRSLLTRILLWHSIAVVLTAVAVSAGVYLFLETSADHLERQTLRAQVGATRKILTIDADGKIAFSASAVDRPKLEAGMNLLVVNDRRMLMATAAAVPPLTIAEIPRRELEVYFRKRSRQSLYAGLSVPINMAGRRIWIVAIQNLDHPSNIVDDLVRQFLTRGLWIVLPLLLLLLGVDAFIVRHALGPVRRASILAQTVSVSRMDVRLADLALPAEVLPLANAVDDAFSRLADSLRTTRDFTADAAHELRTPIAVARMRATEIADPVLRAALIADLDGLSCTVGHLLDIAEVDSMVGLPTKAVDLSDLAEQGIAAIAPLAFRRGRTIELRRAGDPNIVQGQPQFLFRALAALLENAVKHTCEGTHIIVDTRCPGIVSVADDGPGIDLAEQELVFDRFWRRNRAAAGSSGLGLAIVQRVVQSHHGSVTLSSKPGATVFTLNLLGTT